MTLRNPVSICPNPEPGIPIGTGSWVTIRYAKRAGDDGQTRYKWTIIRSGKPDETGDDLQGRGGLRRGLGDLLSFLGAFAESLAYASRTGREGENADLFPATLAKWAMEHSDEISMAGIEVEETDGCIEE